MKRLLLCFVLLSLTIVFMAGESFAAQKQRNTTQSLESSYAAAAKDWRELLANEKLSGRRDAWLNLEKRFLAIAGKDTKGNTGAKAQYQAARCRAELAGRSKLATDWKQAVSLFLVLPQNFPKHSLADDGLYHAALIFAQQLKQPGEARKLAERSLKAYPGGDMAGKSKQLLASLSPSQPQKQIALSGATAGKESTKGPSEKKTEGAKSAPAKTATPGATKQTLSEKASSAKAENLTGIFSRGTIKRSTVMLELDGDARYRYQYLAPVKNGPARLLVDIEGVALGKGVKNSLQFTGMAISAASIKNTGSKGKKSVRVTLDLRNSRHYAVDTGTNPPGIHIHSSISADLARGTPPPAGGKNSAWTEGRYAAGSPARPGSLMEQLGLTVRTVMIDAGHGGKDPGAMGNGIRESAVTLSLAKTLGERLRKEGFTVLYTRDRDSYVALDQRAVLANNKKADLFISVHVNASNDKKTNGVETYFLDLARSSSAATVAARENAVSVKSISDLQFILTDLMLSSKLQESQDLAAIVHRRMLQRVKQAGFTVNDNGVRSAPFYVLMGARMPAVLVEIGYLTNDTDAKRIKSPKYLERLAEGIVQGVVEYKTKLGRFAAK